MGTLFGFVVGYILGARAGNEGFTEVVDSIQAIRESEEFRGFVEAMQSHVRHLLHQVSGRLAGDDELAGIVSDGRPNMPF
jgi:hypothetical protein